MLDQSSLGADAGPQGDDVGLQEADAAPQGNGPCSRYCGKVGRMGCALVGSVQLLVTQPPWSRDVALPGDITSAVAFQVCGLWGAGPPTRLRPLARCEAAAVQTLASF